MSYIKKRGNICVEDIFNGILSQDRSSLGRAITLIESSKREHRVKANELLLKLLPYSGNSCRIGVSGVPGVGKSTFIDAFGKFLTSLGKKVAVLAIDPSSSISGGSILGDKTRMHRLAVDDFAFIRPSPSACTLGGVARRTRESIVLCEAAGFDVVLVETVGVGQSEVTVHSMTDFYLVLMLAGAGDELQGIKKGILELADLVAINKADGDNEIKAKRACQDYINAFHYLRHSTSWQPTALTCSALHDIGLQDIWQTIVKHKELLTSTGEYGAKREEQSVSWMWQLISDCLMDSLKRNENVINFLPKIERMVRKNEVTPQIAAKDILQVCGMEYID